MPGFKLNKFTKILINFVFVIFASVVILTAFLGLKFKESSAQIGSESFSLSSFPTDIFSVSSQAGGSAWNNIAGSVFIADKLGIGVTANYPLHLSSVGPIFLNSGSGNHWWIRGNGGDSQLVIGKSGDISDGNIVWTLSTAGNMFTPGGITTQAGSGSTALTVTKVAGSESVAVFNIDAGREGMRIDRDANMFLGGNFYMRGNQVIDAGGGWFRSYGTSGWYNGTHQGGWFMQDSTWVRSYNDKWIYTGGVMRADSYLQSPRFYDGDDSRWYVDPNATSVLYALRVDQLADGTSTMCYGGGGTPFIGRCSSDIKLKENIRYMEGSILNSILKLKPAVFDLKDGSMQDVSGFIAQDVQQVFPDLVKDTDNNGILELSRDQLVPHAIKAIQELAKENEMQKIKIERLEQELELLKTEVEKLQRK